MKRLFNTKSIIAEWTLNMSMMELIVLVCSNQFKVFQSIIITNAILMMNNIEFSKRASKHLLHKVSMFKNGLVVDVNYYIAMIIELPFFSRLIKRLSLLSLTNSTAMFGACNFTLMRFANFFSCLSREFESNGSWHGCNYNLDYKNTQGIL